jgi:hypothetical protein
MCHGFFLCSVIPLFSAIHCNQTIFVFGFLFQGLLRQLGKETTLIFVSTEVLFKVYQIAYLTLLL